MRATVIGSLVLTALLTATAVAQPADLLVGTWDVQLTITRTTCSQGTVYPRARQVWTVSAERGDLVSLVSSHRGYLGRRTRTGTVDFGAFTIELDGNALRGQGRVDLANPYAVMPNGCAYDYRIVATRAARPDPALDVIGTYPVQLTAVSSTCRDVRARAKSKETWVIAADPDGNVALSRHPIRGPTSAFSGTRKHPGRPAEVSLVRVDTITTYLPPGIEEQVALRIDRDQLTGTARLQRSRTRNRRACQITYEVTGTVTLPRVDLGDPP